MCQECKYLTNFLTKTFYGQAVDVCVIQGINMTEVFGNLIEKFLTNKHYQWVFSGIGIAAIGAIISLIKYYMNKKMMQNLSISTKGDKSPGIVGRDYKINCDDKNKHERK